MASAALPPETTTTNGSEFTAPKALREQKHWVLRKGKVPVNRFGYASDKGLTWKSPNFWGDFEILRNVELLAVEGVSGAGFIVHREKDEHDSVIGIDIYAARNPETGAASPTVLKFLKKLDSPTSVSPSGCGFRAWCTGDLPSDSMSRIGYFNANDLSVEDRAAILAKKGKNLAKKLEEGEQGYCAIEIYAGGPRHLTFTNPFLPDYPMECSNRTELLKELIHDYFNVNEAKKQKAKERKNKNHPYELLRDKFPITIEQLVDVSTFTPEGEQLTGPNPWTGSSSGHNLIINPSEGTWSNMHNFSGGSAPGGDAWLLAACACGAVDWASAGPGSMDDREVIERTKEYVAERGLYSEDDLFPGRKQQREAQKKDAEAAMKVKDEALLDPGLPFRPENIRLFARVKQNDRALYESIVASWKRKVKTSELDKEVDREIKASKRREKAANQRDADADDEGKPVIVITGKHMQDITAECLPAIVAHNTPPYVFIRTGSLVRIKKDEKGTMGIEQLGESSLRGILARAVKFIDINGDKVSNTDPPLKVVKDILALTSWEGIPPIVGIIESPVVRPDGSILDQFGYDSATQLYYANGEKLELRVPDNPMKEDATKAAEYIFDEIFADFPFKDAASKANMMAALITVMTNPLIDGGIPLGLFDKPQAGTGAGLLTEVIAEIATGKPAHFQTAPTSDEEWRKAITSTLLNSPSIVTIDNVEQRLRSPRLAQMLTGRVWRDRMLQQSRMLDLPQSAAWFATGNNIQLGGDIARRAYWIRLDARMSRPWLRTGFKHNNLIKWIREHRSEILSALLTMIRAWIVAGKPKADVLMLGSFNEWCRVVGDILEFAGVHGFLGNANDLYDNADQEITQWDAWMGELVKLHKDVAVATAVVKSELVSMSPQYKDFQDQMPEDIAKAIGKDSRGTQRLGVVLRSRVDQVFPSGRKLVSVYDKHTKAHRWMVEEKKATPPTPEQPDLDTWTKQQH